MNRNTDIINLFEKSVSWEEKYQKIISLGKHLPFFPEENKTDNLLITACQSRLWLKADLNQKGQVIFTGDSEGLITKGLLAIMIQFYSGQTPEDILKSQPYFLKTLNLSQYLSLNRTNGLQSLIHQIQSYAKAFMLLQTTK